jgi:hypothetical protein
MDIRKHQQDNHENRYRHEPPHRIGYDRRSPKPDLTEYRRHHDLLTETNGGCALWTNREWVKTLITKS